MTAGPEIDFLRAHPFSRVLSEPQLERLFRCGTVLNLQPNAFVFREGETAETLFLIRSGQVALEQHVPGRGNVKMETLHAGDVLGFSWLFERTGWTLDARVVEASELFALDGACVHREMQADPTLGLIISTQLAQQMYARLQRVRLQRLDVYRAGL